MFAATITVMGVLLAQSQLPQHSSEQDGARSLLVETTRALNKAGVSYVVVGGWVPFLFHSARFGHPGTYDVDVLIDEESLDNGSFDKAADLLLEAGYLRAPKNRFQAHRLLNVGGETLVFHVDFLNERQPDNELEIVNGRGKLRSIYTPSLQAIFRYKNFRTHPQFPNVHFPSVETFMVTKAAAVSSKKRNRDAFDVFVSALDQEPTAFRDQWRGRMSRDGLFSDANESLVEVIDNGDAISKIMSVLQALQTDPMPSDEYVRDAFKFLIR